MAHILRSHPPPRIPMGKPTNKLAQGIRGAIGVPSSAGLLRPIYTIAPQTQTRPNVQLKSFVTKEPMRLAY
jgi:hypothetical protein